MKRDRPSATAHLIARSLVFLSQEAQTAPLIPPQTVEASRWFMEAASPRAPRLLRWMQRPWFRCLVRTLERWSVPGMMLHYALRKLRLEEIARNALRGGCQQVVVLGAGYDALALRLTPEFPECLFVEIDHPATQAVKRRALAQHGVTPENLVLLPVDMAREGLEEGLGRVSQFCPSAETLFVAEGLLMYLEVPALDRLFRFCKTRGGQRPRIAFTFMERLPDGRIAFRGQSRWVDAWLALRGEPFRWGIPREQMPAYLEARGFTCREIDTAKTLRERYLTSPELRDQPLADGDHVCIAESSVRVSR